MSSVAPVAETSVPPQRHLVLPLLLFLLTCLSTFWVGSVAWRPIGHLGLLYHGVLSFVANLPQGSPWTAMQEALAVADMACRQGLLYMAAVLGILLSHEMGHFVMASRHRIPASLPYFIPVPILPFGTLGAVIGMEGFRANRRELFDLGVAGPLAGLIVALPITWFGIRMLPTTPMAGSGLCFHNPLLLQSMIAWLRPDYPTPNVMYLNQLNPFLMAGWMGMLVTGLNLLPISQLDGGHVAHALLGDHAKFLARGLLLAGIAMILVTEQYGWTVMLILVTLLGADHPPTADDRCRLGLWRQVIGWASLLLPILCFPSMGITPT
ncbi:MAG: site-2 protease family protein [Planctomycetaceae bacterium]|nr:site-2 protease family protein [Planctomycetaceae bacterium]